MNSLMDGKWSVRVWMWTSQCSESVVKLCRRCSRRKKNTEAFRDGLVLIHECCEQGPVSREKSQAG